MKTRAHLLTLAAATGLTVPALAQSPEPIGPAPGVAAAHAPLLVTYPESYRAALDRGTRSPSGRPGPRYWQGWTDYELKARIDPDSKRLEGSAQIRYRNNSPDSLDVLYLYLYQNLHAPGVPRSRPEEVTGGVKLARVEVAGVRLEEGAGYEVDGTVMRVEPPRPVPPGGVERIGIDWAFDVPHAGASARMGWSRDNLMFLAYWYPQLAVYNDVVGWERDPFTGTAEFYAGFAHYDVTVEAPDGWVIAATGRLRNVDEVLAPAVAARLRRAEASDSVISVIGAEDLRRGATRSSEDGTLSWSFSADSVRDFAFAASRESLWDAARTPVGDRDGDGELDYARVDAIYRSSAFRWSKSARYAQHAISFLSRFTGVSYPWPHMTAVEGAEIISGGMEFPMMTLIGDYNERSDTALYGVTAHEFAHMWVPMMVNTDERRYAWMDEGTTRFNGHEAVKEYYPGLDPVAAAARSYVEAASSEDEGEIMRWSDHHYTYGQYRMASYSKPEMLLALLRTLLGEEVFNEAYHTYLRSWSFKHPYPWDFFNTFETVSDRDLDWFWRSWYYETWVLDQAVAAVEPAEAGTRIVVRGLGTVPMPVPLVVRRADGRATRLEIPVSVWLSGAEEAAVVVPAGSPVTEVTIDPDSLYPDIDRRNNVWRR